jgi:hypothetical protein
VGINTNAGNSDFLDIYLEGEADGWVAVGFSATSSMVRSYSKKRTIMGCRHAINCKLVIIEASYRQLVSSVFAQFP